MQFTSLVSDLLPSCPPALPPHFPLLHSLHPSLTLPAPSATPPLNTPRRGAYATNSQVRNAACVCKDSLSDTRCFVCTVYAVFPPDTHGEVRVQYTLKSYTPTSSQDLKSNCYPGIYVYVYVCVYVYTQVCICVYIKIHPSSNSAQT